MFDIDYIWDLREVDKTRRNAAREAKYERESFLIGCPHLFHLTETILTLADFVRSHRDIVKLDGAQLRYLRQP